MGKVDMDFSWATEGIKKIKEYNTLKSEKGQKLYNRVWLSYDLMPRTVEEWDELFEEIEKFVNDPANPQEDKDKITDKMENAWLMRSGCKGIEEEKKGKDDGKR